MRVEAVVEVPKGSRNKYEMDHEKGAMWLDRELFTATRYPADYGRSRQQHPGAAPAVKLGSESED